MHWFTGLFTVFHEQILREEYDFNLFSTIALQYILVFMTSIFYMGSNYRKISSKIDEMTTLSKGCS